MDWATKVSGFNSRQKRDISVFSTAFKRVLGFTQFSAPCIIGTLSVGMSGQGVILTTRRHAVARLKVCGARILLGIIFRVIMPN
jgi:hypothetical protein